MLGIALTDLDDKVVNFRASDHVNSIAQILAHVVMGEDRLINASCKGGERLFDAQGWEAKTGIPGAQGAVWNEKAWQMNIPAFLEYQREIEKAAMGYVLSASPEELEREVTFGPFVRPVADQLRGVLIHHMLGHSGEISALKGVQGLKGLPF
jgi:hypothetical protein